MTAVCCDLCFRKISHIHRQTAELWLDLCASFVKFEGKMTLAESRIPWAVPLMRNLEKHGYITTCDGKETVQVRVNGYDKVECVHDCLETFCINRMEHDISWI